MAGLTTKHTRKVTRVLASFLREYGVWTGDDRPLMVAVSGGPDSVCLIHALAQLRGRLGVPLHACHFDHGIRGDESLDDARYVASLCKDLGVSLTSKDGDVPSYQARRRISLEEAARVCRYAFFGEVAKEIDAQTVLLGHTADDQAETILMHILRGTGVTGLKGMEAIKMEWDGSPGDIALGRPLLGMARSDTEGYCRDMGLRAREDSSNRSKEHLRNRIRLDVIPLLGEVNPRVVEGLVRLGENAKVLEGFLNEEVSRWWPTLVTRQENGFSVDRLKLANLPEALVTHLIRRVLRELRGGLRGIRSENISAITKVALGPTGKSLVLGRGLRITARSSTLEFSLKQVPAPEMPRAVTLRVPGVTRMGIWEIRASLKDVERSSEEGSPFVGVLDTSYADRTLWVRTRRDGDRFRPRGMAGTRKVQDFMVDAKIARADRDLVPLLCDEDGILWVVGHRLDARVDFVSPGEKALCLEFVLAR